MNKTLILNRSTSSYVHSRNRPWIGKGLPEPGTNGHHRGAKKGDRIRVRLHKKKGRYEVLFPNGIILSPSRTPDPLRPAG